MLKDSLLELFRISISESSFEGSLSVAGSLVEDGIDMPVSLECVLIDFLTYKDSDSFAGLAREVLSQNMLGDYIESIKLIGFLASKKWLPLRDVALFLNAIPHPERSSLPPTYQKALDVADLICDDLSDGFMEAEDDDLLLNALNNL